MNTVKKGAKNHIKNSPEASWYFEATDGLLAVRVIAGKFTCLSAARTAGDLEVFSNAVNSPHAIL